MPHVTGHFCVCHVELWLLFHDFFPVPGYLDLDLVSGYLGIWVSGYLGIWVSGYTRKATFLGYPKKVGDMVRHARK